jgi:hypothetical protein
MKDKKFSRRQMIQTSALAAGAVVLGSSLLREKTTSEPTELTPFPRFLVVGPPRTAHVLFGQELAIALSKKVPTQFWANRLSVPKGEGKFYDFFTEEKDGLYAEQVKRVEAEFATLPLDCALVLASRAGDLGFPALQALLDRGVKVLYVDFSDRHEHLASYLAFKKHRLYIQPADGTPILPATKLAFDAKGAAELTSDLNYFYSMRDFFPAYTYLFSDHQHAQSSIGALVNEIILRDLGDRGDHLPGLEMLRVTEAVASLPFKELLDSNEPPVSDWLNQQGQKA